MVVVVVVVEAEVRLWVLGSRARTGRVVIARVWCVFQARGARVPRQTRDLAPRDERRAGHVNAAYVIARLISGPLVPDQDRDRGAASGPAARGEFATANAEDVEEAGLRWATPSTRSSTAAPASCRRARRPKHDAPERHA